MQQTKLFPMQPIVQADLRRPTLNPTLNPRRSRPCIGCAVNAINFRVQLSIQIPAVFGLRYQNVLVTGLVTDLDLDDRDE